MKILHVVEVDHGGVISLLDLYTRHQSAHHDVHVLAPPSAPTLPGARHHWEPSRRSGADLLRAEGRLHTVVAQEAPDVVHLHSFFPGLLGRRRPLPGRPLVVHQPHSWAFDAVPGWAAGIVGRLERAAATATDVLVTNCADELREGRQNGVRTPAVTIGLPVDVDRFVPAPGPPSTAPAMVVCVGRLCRQKGQVELARAWEAEARDDAVLVLVGPGDPDPVAAAAPRSWGRSIVHVGNQRDVRPWLQQATVAVQPSLYEGESVAMAEALACGVPVVITDVNGAREAVAPPGRPAAGAVVPVGQVPLLLEEAMRRVQDPRLRAREASVARRRAVRLFAPPTVLANLDRAYLSALAGTRAGAA